MAQQWWLYLLECEHGMTYVGIATDLAARIAKHTAGSGARFTRANPPRQLLGAQPFDSRSDATQAERALKRKSKAAKLDWARRWPPPAGVNSSRERR